MTDSNHYTAVLDITRTMTPPAPSSSSSRGYGASHAEPAPKREVVDVTKLVIRADTLTELTARLNAHTALIAQEATS